MLTLNQSAMKELKISPIEVRYTYVSFKELLENY